MDSIVKYVATNKRLEEIHLTWFGGEPLMAISQMRVFYKKLMQKWGSKRFISNIITTGYHISPEVISVLKEIQVSSMQITLDGDKDYHNKIKYLDECEDVFSRIIHNIDLIANLAPEINVVIRVNLSRENADQYVDLFRFLANRYQNKNVGIAPGFVENRAADKSTQITDDYFLNREEKTKFMFNIFNKYRIHTPFLSYPSRFLSECAIRNENAIGVDPLGYVYKCWEMIGNSEFSVGKLENGKMSDVNHTLLNRQMYGADPIEDRACSVCSYLPLCGGGCPIQRIENDFENRKNNCCSLYKGFIPEYLNIYMKLKKEGYNNYQ
jgi:uncharacterized protein